MTLGYKPEPAWRQKPNGIIFTHPYPYPSQEGTLISPLLGGVGVG